MLKSDSSPDGHTTESLKKHLIPDQLINTLYQRNFDFSEGLPSKFCATSLHFINIDNRYITDVLSDGMGSWQNLGAMHVNNQQVFKVTNKSYKQPIERRNLSKNFSVSEEMAVTNLMICNVVMSWLLLINHNHDMIMISNEGLTLHTEKLATGKPHKPTVFGCYVDLAGFEMSE